VCQRLRETNQALLLNRRVRDGLINQLLNRLPPEERQQVLRASVLDRVSPPALRALFSEDVEKMMPGLALLGMQRPEASDPILAALRDRFEQEVGSEAVRQFARESASRLASAGCWEDALSLAARCADRQLLLKMLGRALRESLPIASERAVEWLEQLPDEEPAREAHVALAKASHYRRLGDPASAAQLLRRAIDSARAGSSPDAVRRLKETLRTYEEVGLTQREMEVLALLAEGLTNPEITERLVISVRTAETHVNHVLGKLGCSSRARAAAWAVERGLARPRPLRES
jgi:DNA-binding CsgD family transcriptional regulator